jgi:tRNA/tmRNA/rRNA uracil-C5-methylase (TrmA/RlmC/RlmD family)
VPGAIDRAEESCRLLHLPAEFQRGAVLDRLPEIGRRVAGRGPVVVVDPARRGLEDNVVEGILALQPAQVAYLSCNPRALATDLQRFVAAGWSIRALRAYDMFPQTAHVELLALLSPPTPPVVTARAPRRKILR